METIMQTVKTMTLALALAAMAAAASPALAHCGGGHGKPYRSAKAAKAPAVAKAVQPKEQAPPAATSAPDATGGVAELGRSTPNV
jgi:hypothetical protein